MKKLVPTTRSRRLMAAVVVGTVLSALGGEAQASPVVQPSTDAVSDISRYCQVCWRNARLHPDSWQDCTQEVLVRLLQSIKPDRWNGLLKNEGDDRREFFRAIDAVKKRTQRARKFTGLVDEVADRRNQPEAARNELRADLDRAAQVLSQRQQRILSLTQDGWSVPDIAEEMRTTVERVSDEKYKAIRKLRQELKA